MQTRLCRADDHAASTSILGVLVESVRNEMLATKWMHFPVDVILAYIRWYPAYPLSNRHLEEMMRSCWLTPSIVQSICTKPPSPGDQSKTNWTSRQRTVVHVG